MTSASCISYGMSPNMQMSDVTLSIQKEYMQCNLLQLLSFLVWRYWGSNKWPCLELQAGTFFNTELWRQIIAAIYKVKKMWFIFFSWLFSEAKVTSVGTKDSWNESRVCTVVMATSGAASIPEKAHTDLLQSRDEWYAGNKLGTSSPQVILSFINT